MRLPFVIAIILACMACLWRCHGATVTVSTAAELTAFTGTNLSGDTVICTDGNYVGNWNVGSTGRSVSNVTFRAQNKWRARLIASDVSNPVLATPPGLGGSTIDGFEITGTSTASGILLGPGLVGVGSDSNTVRNCWIHNNGTNFGNAFNGVESHCCKGTLFERNLIESNGCQIAYGGRTHGHGIYTDGTNVTIRANVLRWNGSSGAQVYRDPGDFWSCINNAQFYNNLSYGNFEYALILGGTNTDANSHYVYNNTLLQGPDATKAVLYVTQSGQGYLTNNCLVGGTLRSGSGPALIGNSNYVTTSYSDPLFVNSTNGLYWLSASSPCRNAADTNVVPVVDFFGNTLGDSGELVRNPGFETGTFSPGWGGLSPPNAVLFYPWAHSGAYGVQVGPTVMQFLSQTLNTQPGATYTLSCWLKGDGLTPNRFQIIFDGVTNVDLTDITYVGWTQFVYTVTASTASTLMQFGFQNTPSYFGFDDVSVAKHGPGITDVGAFQYDVLLTLDTRVLDPSPPTGADYWANNSFYKYIYDFTASPMQGMDFLTIQSRTGIVGENYQMTCYTDSGFTAPPFTYGMIGTNPSTNIYWLYSSTNALTIHAFTDPSGIIHGQWNISRAKPDTYYFLPGSLVHGSGSSVVAEPAQLRAVSIR